MSRFRRKSKPRKVAKTGAEVGADAVESAACCCIVEEVFDPCFVATAAHGSPAAPEVVVLRRYRDEVLVRRRAGRTFTAVYYRLGPYGARALHGRPAAKAATRAALRPVVAYARRRTGG